MGFGNFATAFWVLVASSSGFSQYGYAKCALSFIENGLSSEAALEKRIGFTIPEDWPNMANALVDEIGAQSRKVIDAIVRGINLKEARIFSAMTASNEGKDFELLLSASVWSVLNKIEAGSSFDAILLSVTELRASQVRSGVRGANYELYRLTSDDHGLAVPQRPRNGRKEEFSLWENVRAAPRRSDYLPQILGEFKDGIHVFHFRVEGPGGKVRLVPGHSIGIDYEKTGWQKRLDLYVQSAGPESQSALFRDSMRMFQLVANSEFSSRSDGLAILFGAYQRYVVSMPTFRGTAATADILLASLVYHICGKALPIPPSGIRRDFAALSFGEEDFINFMFREYPELLD